MTLFAHKLLDALHGKSRERVETVPDVMTDKLTNLLKLTLPLAEKFDFQEMPLEPDPSGAPGAWKLPHLTDDEMDFWNQGLIPLPAPDVWYEFELGGTRSAYYIISNGSQWHVTRVDYVRQDGEWFFNMDCVVTTVHVGSWKNAHDSIKFDIAGPNLVMDMMRRKDPTSNEFASNIMLTIYMTLMLNSRTTAQVEERPSVKLNAKRMRNGHVPMYTHRVVTIVTKEFRQRGDDQGGTHASPRLHWRRSHLRRLPSGKTVVIPRFLVGRAELGEVTHEYRVRPSHQAGEQK